MTQSKEISFACGIATPTVKPIPSCLLTIVSGTSVRDVGVMNIFDDDATWVFAMKTSDENALSVALPEI